MSRIDARTVPSAKRQLSTSNVSLTVNSVNEHRLDVPRRTPRVLGHRRNVLPVPPVLLGLVIRRERRLGIRVGLGQQGFDNDELGRLAVGSQPGDGALARPDLVALLRLDEAAVQQDCRAARLAAIEGEDEVVTRSAVARLRALQDGGASEAALDEDAAEGKVWQCREATRCQRRTRRRKAKKSLT